VGGTLRTKAMCVCSSLPSLARIRRTASLGTAPITLLRSDTLSHMLSRLWVLSAGNSDVFRGESPSLSGVLLSGAEAVRLDASGLWRRADLIDCSKDVIASLPEDKGRLCASQQNCNMRWYAYFLGV
jgi:hypothetical protein